MQSGTASRMIRTMDALSSVERLRQAFMGHERGVAAVYLFGSVARGESRPGSDLDVAVLLEPAPERGAFESLRLGLRAELESELGQEIDFVVLNKARRRVVGVRGEAGGALFRSPPRALLPGLD